MCVSTCCFFLFSTQLIGQRHITAACVGCQQPVHPTQAPGFITVQYTWIQQWYVPLIALDRDVQGNFGKGC